VVTITVRSQSPSGGVPFITHVVFGDGDDLSPKVHIACPAHPVAGPTADARVIRHAYAAHEMYRLVITVTGECAGEPAPVGTGSITVIVP
jgi:hypothetical protein